MALESNIRISRYAEFDLYNLKELIHFTIRSCYPKVYPVEVIDYFIDYHKQENIREMAKNGHTILLKLEDILIGTGNLTDNYINAVYIRPDHQKKGYGAIIVNNLLNIAKCQGIKKVFLHSTLLAKKFYDHMGFKTTRETSMLVENGRKLEYFDMETEC